MVKRRTIKHKWTPEEDEILRVQYRGTHQSSGAIAAFLNNAGATPPISGFAVQGRVSVLCLAQRETKRWSEREMHLLREWTGRYPPKVIAKKFKRGFVSVKVKQKKMGLCLRTKDGWYTKKDVAEMMGVDHKKVQLWMDAEYLPAVPYDVMPQKNSGGQWFILEKDVRAFLLRFPQELIGRNVDLLQIFDILVPAGVNGNHKLKGVPQDEKY